MNIDDGDDERRLPCWPFAQLGAYPPAGVAASQRFFDVGFHGGVATPVDTKRKENAHPVASSRPNKQHLAPEWNYIEFMSVRCAHFFLGDVCTRQLGLFSSVVRLKKKGNSIVPIVRYMARVSLIFQCLYF